MWRQILRYGFFPAALVATPWAVHRLLEAGWHLALATYVPVALLGLAYLLAEHWIQYRREWNTPVGDIGTDVLSGAIAYVLIPRLFGPLYWAGRYWGHRLAHEIPLLWRFHAVHHSPGRLWFFNAVRQHPVDKLWFMASELLVPILLGASGEVLSLYFAVTAVCGFAQHTNADLRLGPLYWVFNVVEMHRWHHSRNPAESDHNYGNNLIVYDRLFGTCFHPEARGERQGVGPIGLLNPNYPRRYWGQLLAPFRRGQLDKADPEPLRAPSSR